ncbi:MAG: S8 family serine peptidase [Rikenellaceae bacterium]|nr:S8 family serine peptidase [Rikenellaceae bacterium]
MRKFTIGIVSLFFLLLHGCTSDQTPQVITTEGSESAKIAAFSEDIAIPGKVIIKLKEEPKDESELTTTRNGNTEVSTGLVSLDRIAAEIGARSMRRLFRHAGKFEPRTRAAGMHLWYVVEFDKDISVTRAATDLAGSEFIEFIEPVVPIIRSGGTLVEVKETDFTAGAETNSSTFGFNDPMLSVQWNYNNDGTRGSNYLAGADIRLDGAWAYTTGHPDVIVAVVDTGVGYDHPDLAANMWINQAELNGSEGNDDDGNGFVDDIYGYNFCSDIGAITIDDHGTHVAGTIAAVNNNGLGVAGIAGGDGTPGSGVRIMSCQIFGADGENDADYVGSVEAIKYGADNGAVISQNSWGYPNGYRPPYVSAYQAAINYFVENAGMDENGNQSGPMKGGLVVFAAGNSGISSLSYPASLDNCISVASFGPRYLKVGHSNYGTWVTISAPGGDQDRYGSSHGVMSTISYITNGRVVNSYGYFQGTSMACPHVSGVAALYVSLYGVGQPGLTPDKVKARMLETAFPELYDYNAGYTGMLGAGGIDATAMLTPEDTPEPSQPEVIKAFPRVNLSVIGETRTLDLDHYFTDPDKGALTYTAAMETEGVVTCVIKDNVICFTSVASGSTRVEITAYNQAGLYVSSTVTIVSVNTALKPGEPREPEDRKDIFQ